jgi:hypothetical protein
VLVSSVVRIHSLEVVTALGAFFLASPNSSPARRASLGDLGEVRSGLAVARMRHPDIPVMMSDDPRIIAK